MPYIGYAVILTICLIVGLVAHNRIPERWYPYLLYGMGASMILMTTLAGPYLVGSDIHLEYYYAKLHSGGDVLKPLADIPQSTSIVSTIIAPNLPIPLLWTYKVVFPLLLALAPVLVYFVFRKWFTAQQAFLSAFLIIAFPTFFLELPAIARQMVSSLVFALVLYFLVASNLRLRYRLALIAVCAGLLPLVHYSLGIIIPGILGVSLLLSWKLRRSLVKPLSVALVACVLVGALYFPFAGGGSVAIWVVHIYNDIVPESIRSPWDPKLPDLAYNPTPDLYPERPEPSKKPADYGSVLSKYGSILQGGMGADFFETTMPGKAFRLLQWLMAILAIIGLWKLRKHYEYRALAWGCLILLLILMTSGFSKAFNVTRLIHLSLFMLAPLLIITLRPKYLLLVLLPYFLFASGFVFEVTKQTNVESLTIPYSIALSNHRLDLGASLNRDDKRVRDYITDNELYPVYSDIWSSHFMGEVVGWRDDLNRTLERTPGKIPGGYVYIRSRNIKDGTFTNWNGIGCRRSVTPDEYGINWDENIIFQSGDARVVEIR